MSNKLSAYRNKFLGQTAVIVGSGPTNFNYGDIYQFEKEPVFFINDALLTIKEYKDNHYFFSIHQDVTRWWYADVIWLKWTGSIARPKRYVEANFICGGPAPRPKWHLDADYCERKNHLGLRYGSIGGIIHFLWFTGCRSILGIGINPNVSVETHDPRIDGEICPNIRNLCKFQVEDLNTFCIEAKYI